MHKHQKMILCDCFIYREYRVQYWTNLHSILKRAQLHALKASPAYVEYANPLGYLAEMPNNHEEFMPQNLMMETPFQTMTWS